MTTKEINLVITAEEIVMARCGKNTAEILSAFPTKEDYLQEVLRVYELIKEKVK